MFFPSHLRVGKKIQRKGKKEEREKPDIGILTAISSSELFSLWQLLVMWKTKLVVM